MCVASSSWKRWEKGIFQGSVTLITLCSHPTETYFVLLLSWTTKLVVIRCSSVLNNAHLIPSWVSLLVPDVNLPSDLGDLGPGLQLGKTLVKPNLLLVAQNWVNESSCVYDIRKGRDTERMNTPNILPHGYRESKRVKLTNSWISNLYWDSGCTYYYIEPDHSPEL